VDAPDSATDATAFAKDVPATSWKMAKMNVAYKVGAEPEAAKKSAGGGGAPETAKKSAGGKAAA